MLQSRFYEGSGDAPYQRTADVVPGVS